MADKSTLDELGTTQPADASAEAERAAAAQSAYDAQKTGDPIGDADLRATLGVPTTPEEEDKLTEQQVLMMTSPSIQARERFEESAAALPGAATPGHDEAYAKFQDDTQKATVDRDPQAYADERAALGLTTTPEDIAKFQHPTLNDIFAAERQGELVGMPVEDSTLAAQHVALQDQLNKAYIDHNVDEFVKAREMQGLPTTPADIAAFNNPTPTDVLNVARQDALQGIQVPDGSALAQQIGNVMNHEAPGNVAPTHTQDSPQQQGSGSTTTSGSGSGSGTTPTDRGDFGSTGTGVSHGTSDQPAAGGGAGAGGAASPGDAGAGATPAPSPIDAGLANLSGGTPSEPDIPTSRGTGSAGSTDGLGYQAGATNYDAEHPVAGSTHTAVVDDSGKGMTSVGGQSVDSDGGVTIDQPGGGTITSYPDGTSVYKDSEGHTTGTATGTDYEATAKPSGESASNESTTSSTSTESTSTESTSTESNTDTTSNDDNTDTTSNDDSSNTAMTNPDDATRPTGLAAGLAPTETMSSGSGSSTHGGATDGVRGDLSTGLDPVTGELAMKPTAGPDVDPDHQTTDGGTDVYHSGTGVGAVDGARPDLFDAGTPTVEAPTTTGTNPYGSAGQNETAGSTIGVAGGTVAGNTATAGATGGTHLGDASMATTGLNIGAVSAQANAAQEHGSAAFGGPPGDGRGSSSSAATAADSSTVTQNAQTTDGGSASVQNVGSGGGGIHSLADAGGADSAATGGAAAGAGAAGAAAGAPEGAANAAASAAGAGAAGAASPESAANAAAGAPEAAGAGTPESEAHAAGGAAGAGALGAAGADSSAGAAAAGAAGAESATEAGASTQAEPGDTKASADQDPHSQADEQTAAAAPTAGAEASTQAEPGDTKASADQDPHSAPDEQTATAEHSDPLGMINVTALSSAIVDPVPQFAASPDPTFPDHTLAGGAFHTVASGAIPDPRASEAGMAPAGDPPVDHVSIIIPETDLTAMGGEPDIDHAAMAHIDLGASEPADTAPEHHDDATPDHIDVPFGGPLDDGLG